MLELKLKKEVLCKQNWAIAILQTTIKDLDIKNLTISANVEKNHCNSNYFLLFFKIIESKIV